MIIHCHLLKKLTLHSAGNLDSLGRSLSRRKTRSHSTAGALAVQPSNRWHLSYWSMEKEILPCPWTSGLCSLPQLCSYHRSCGTPGVFHSGNLEGEGELTEEAFTIIATQGCCSFMETLGECVSSWDREGSTLYAINVLWNRVRFQPSMFHPEGHTFLFLRSLSSKTKQRGPALRSPGGGMKCSGLQSQR